MFCLCATCKKMFGQYTENYNFTIENEKSETLVITLEKCHVSQQKLDIVLVIIIIIIN